MDPASSDVTPVGSPARPGLAGQLASDRHLGPAARGAPESRSRLGARHRHVILVHGFTQTGRSLAHIAENLVENLVADAEVLTIDLPGHGGSPPLDDGQGLGPAAALLGATGGRGVYVGYSMGARLCLRLALDDPGLVEGLVLIGATPGIEDTAERAARKASDSELACLIERSSLDAFLEQWLAGPLFAHLSPEQADRASRRENTPTGLASTLRALGTGAEPPMWGRLGELFVSAIPVLLVAGEHDKRYRAIARRMAQDIGPRAQLVVVHGSGHSVPAERGEVLAELIGRFVEAVAKGHWGAGEQDRAYIRGAPGR